ncbi:MAG: CAP domain-containing protein [Rhodospirillaceae bacterium]|nr:CAP domain-containing protein [Rhodospirillaceae bacterium]
MSPELRQMVQEINAVRAQYGLPAVGLDGRLMQAAQAYSQELAAQGRLTHGDFMTRMRALGPGYGYVAENLAAGMPGSSAVVRAWMHSPAHRANLLAPVVTVVGVARSGAVWTLILAQRGA